MAPQGRRDRDTDSNANISDPENPAVEASPPPPPSLGYSTTDCAICLAEFAVGDAIHVLPACHHSFHAICIERWLAGGRRSSCPTCRAPDAVATAAAANSDARDYEIGVGFAILAALQLAAMALALLDATVRYFRERK